jgi:hypothetical protein
LDDTVVGLFSLVFKTMLPFIGKNVTPEVICATKFPDLSLIKTFKLKLYYIVFG